MILHNTGAPRAWARAKRLVVIRSGCRQTCRWLQEHAGTSGHSCMHAWRSGIPWHGSSHDCVAPTQDSAFTACLAGIIGILSDSPRDQIGWEWHLCHVLLIPFYSILLDVASIWRAEGEGECIMHGRTTGATVPAAALYTCSALCRIIDVRMLQARSSSVAPAPAGHCHCHAILYHMLLAELILYKLASSCYLPPNASLQTLIDEHLQILQAYEQEWEWSIEGNEPRDDDDNAVDAWIVASGVCRGKYIPCCCRNAKIWRTGQPYAPTIFISGAQSTCTVCSTILPPFSFTCHQIFTVAILTIHFHLQKSF
jgi:hypothetical protein